MSDAIKHECGLAYIRLRKSFSYYQKEYGSVFYGINKLYLLMEKQHNRGQDGAGVAAVKLNTEPGYPFMHRLRSIAPNSIAEIFKTIGDEINELEKYQPDFRNHPGLLKGHLKMLGEVLLGHLRYGTQGRNDVNFCHPFVKRDVIPNRNLTLAGNFNMVNTEELFDTIQMVPGAFQKQSDLAAMMEVLHHYLVESDKAHNDAFEITEVLQKATSLFDGGYHFGGAVGNGDSFVMRDPHGIRPAYYYIGDDVVVAASERSAIRTAFNLGENEVKELMPGCALIVTAGGDVQVNQILEPKERKACSFERIYFSRGSDEKIYRERMQLGYNLSATVLRAVKGDLKNTIFSYIPNTAETAFLGLVKGCEDYLNQIKVERIKSWGTDINEEKLTEMINRKIRMEKIAVKDVKLRTFITEDSSRTEMVQHVYDITYGTVRENTDALVVIDDSIVRGTTLRESIIRMLARLKPSRIIILSSAPQIRYPDCYGIDMSKMGDFVAFQAAVALLKETGKENILTEVYAQCQQLEKENKLHTENLVKKIYEPFTAVEVARKIAQLITPPEVDIKISVIFQKIEDLHQACPNNKGDWYFTGNYPTPGGNRVCNKAFMNYMAGKNVRGY